MNRAGAVVVSTIASCNLVTAPKRMERKPFESLDIF